jgi:heme/copper-type cytochrome/quinol oxidase subunit 3
MVATLSFVIPVLNLWWPYQATLDMTPAGDPHRVVIRRWWILWLSGTLSGLLIYPAAALSNEAAARVIAILGAAAMLGAAIAARAVVEYVTSTHEQLAQSASAAG